jgi:DNA-binding HxlR family transcriptional regulator
MSRRTYQQFCPLAYTLDVIGERWTLLLVRELMYGPRRYSDLLRGLPGIGTNLLAKRLKELEKISIIQQRTLPPPAASKVYELTEYGMGLREVIAVMSKWGMSLLQLPIPAEESFAVVQAMSSLRLMFHPPSANDAHLTCEIHSDNEVFFAAIDGEMIKVSQGTAINPDIIIQAELKALPNIIGNFVSLEAALSDGKIVIVQGDANTLSAFFDLFHASFPVSG